MNGRFQMQGGKNWFLPKEMNANRFFWDSHWLEIWSNHFYPSMGPNGGSVAMDSVLPNLGTPLCAIILVPVVFRIDHVLDISGHFAEKQDLYDLVQRVRLQGDELVQQDGRLVVPSAWAVFWVALSP
jgi:hypothetical protein